MPNPKTGMFPNVGEGITLVTNENAWANIEVPGTGNHASNALKRAGWDGRTATVTTVEFMHKRCIPLFKKFSSKKKIRRHKQMTNFHEFQHTQCPANPARRAHCRLVGAILYPVAGRMTRCSEPARHNTLLLSKHQTEEDRRRGGGEARHFYVTNYQEL